MKRRLPLLTTMAFVSVVGSAYADEGMILEQRNEWKLYNSITYFSIKSIPLKRRGMALPILAASHIRRLQSSRIRSRDRFLVSGQ